MFTYLAYGLGIHSELPLPEFITASAQKDVIIRLGKSQDPADENREKWPYINISSEEAILSFRGIGTYLIHHGQEIIIIPEPDVDDRLIRLYLVGTVMAVLLYQRGLLVLHASAIKINGGAIAFLGSSGSGKSSVAAACYKLGFGIITDDVTGVNISNGKVTIVPGFPQLKLSYASAKILGYSKKSLIQLGESIDKGGFRLKNDFMNQPLPLNRIYVLAKDSEYGINRISPQSAVIEFVRHSYPTRFAQSDGADHFLQCVYLAKSVPVYRLNRPFTEFRLNEVAQLVNNHIIHET